MSPTQLMFLCLASASFAPVVMGLRPGWWMVYYYGALLVWWGLVSVGAVRRAAPKDQTAERPLGGTVRRLLDSETAVTVGTHADAASQALTKKRLIIVARDKVGLYGRIRSRILKGLLEDEAVRIIMDRRGTDRRRQLEVYIPDRRRTERRRFDVEPLLRTRGWAEVRLPRG
jgi:hypothetical protein